MRMLLLVAATCFALPVAAVTFAGRFPAGSITTSSQADTALKDADAAMRAIQQDAKSRDAACYRSFLVNSCRDDVRREKELAEREVRRVQLEARELQRRLEAEAVAKRREKEAQAQAAEDAERQRKQGDARADQAAREAKLKQRDGAERAGEPGAAASGNVSKKPSTVAPSKSAQPPRSPSSDLLTAAERAENARKFEQKQTQAAERAREQQAQRVKNEQRRAEKRKEMEQREAEREALRQKAAQLPK